MKISMELLCQSACVTEVHVNYLTSIRYKAIALFSLMASFVSSEESLYETVKIRLTVKHVCGGLWLAH